LQPAANLGDERELGSEKKRFWVTGTARTGAEMIDADEMSSAVKPFEKGLGSAH